MNQTDQIRNILNLLESASRPLEEVKQGKIGRIVAPRSSGSDSINREPIPYADKAGKNSGEDWMRKAIGIDDKKSERVYLNPENPNPNRRIPMLVTFSPTEEAWIYVPDNGARTLGDVSAKIIARNLGAMGLKQDRDFKIDKFHHILKIMGKERRI